MITFDSKNPPKTIPLGEEPWNAPPKTLPADFKFEQSQSALARSQQILDMQAAAQRAEEEAQQAGSLGGLARETGKQFLGNIAPVAGGIAGAIGGTITGGPVGGIIGAGAGTAAGYAGGERLKGNQPTVQDTATAGALGAIPLPGAKLLGKIPGVARAANYVREQTPNLQRAASAVMSPIKNFLAQRAEKKAADAVGKVLQGETKDAANLGKTLSDLDTKGVNTYADLRDRAAQRVNLISTKLDEALETDKSTRLLGNLKTKVSANGVSVEHNYVSEALDQLENFYTKTANVAARAGVQQLRQKAATTGLTAKEINEIAKVHGRDLSGFNASGELASGLSKQAAENTRTGVKTTARGLFGNPASQQADVELSKLIKVRDLANEMTEQVNTLKQKALDRTLPQKVGHLIEQVVNIATLGTSRGLFQAVAKQSGVLTKQSANAVELEKQLANNLKLIQKAADPKASEKTIIESLEQVIKEAGEKPGMLQLPAQASKPVGAPMYAGLGGQVSFNLQEVVDAIGKFRPPKTSTPPKAYRPPKQPPVEEPYIPQDKLPVIDFGNKPPRKKTSLPVIR